ncbi:MAG: hypothetical protein J3K34DRAFT_412483 [Monoraphidium minutum]|nr:MAG: hypothetical protein J3K34DRAFT_412483 [Monoraphidium minutum]
MGMVLGVACARVGAARGQRGVKEAKVRGGAAPSDVNTLSFPAGRPRGRRPRGLAPPSHNKRRAAHGAARGAARAGACSSGRGARARGPRRAQQGALEAAKGRGRGVRAPCLRRVQAPSSSAAALAAKVTAGAPPRDGAQAWRVACGARAGAAAAEQRPRRQRGRLAQGSTHTGGGACTARGRLGGAMAGARLRGAPPSAGRSPDLAAPRAPCGGARTGGVKAGNQCVVISQREHKGQTAHGLCKAVFHT